MGAALSYIIHCISSLLYNITMSQDLILLPLQTCVCYYNIYTSKCIFLRKENAMNYGGSIGEGEEVATFLQIFLNQYKITAYIQLKQAGPLM
jgi:hypothetical protein